MLCWSVSLSPPRVGAGWINLLKHKYLSSFCEKKALVLFDRKNYSTLSSLHDSVALELLRADFVEWSPADCDLLPNFTLISYFRFLLVQIMELFNTLK